MPCHGDQGQGLTDEFRTRVYPPEDANCWNSGCHGARPYDNGFTIPKTIPALIGADALQRFATADGLYHFIRSAMPYNAPGSLSDTEYLQLTAFLLERNNVMPANTILNSASLATISLHGAQSPAPTAQSGADYMLLVLALPLLAVACLFLIARRRCMMRTSIQ
jgi:cytochrome c